MVPCVVLLLLVVVVWVGSCMVVVPKGAVE
jgi:hypothetical protein